MNTMTVSPMQPKYVTKLDFDDFQDTVANEFIRVQSRLDEVESHLSDKIDGLEAGLKSFRIEVNENLKGVKNEIIKEIKMNNHE